MDNAKILAILPADVVITLLDGYMHVDYYYRRKMQPIRRSMGWAVEAAN